MNDTLRYQAVTRRDARFDGRFFTAVKTTSVYCRPICPARTPRRENVRFFDSAAAAEEAGFRACLRCRPDAAPGTPGWLGPAATVTRALRLIDAGALDREHAQALGERLGVGERHLRRLFSSHLGTSPNRIARSRRTHFARSLLASTSLSVAEVALAAGFGSVRQLNATVKETFGRPPSALRRTLAALADAKQMTLLLAFRPPLEWNALLSFLAARAIPGVERVAAGRYARSFSEAGVLEVAMADDGRHLLLSVEGARPAELFGLAQAARRLFDLDADPEAIATCLRLGGDGVARSVRSRPGLRVPGAFEPLEMFVRAILGQQVSVQAATTLSGRLVEAFGQPLTSSAREGLTHVFPNARQLAKADIERIGLPRARAEAIRSVAEAFADGSIEPTQSLGLAPLVESLCRLEGVGPWTAQYLAMRVYGEPDAFPAGDLLLRRVASTTGEPLSVREPRAPL